MGIKTAHTEQNDSMDGAFEPRLEDYRLLTGAGNFQDDEATAGAAWGVFVRSPHAFADIRGRRHCVRPGGAGGTRASRLTGGSSGCSGCIYDQCVGTVRELFI